MHWIREMLFPAVGGLGLFIFGMELLSDGLRKAAGQKLKHLLEIVTKRTIVAVFVGILITCLVQSSSATTVMTVGFVNAGLLTLKQALGVIFGSNIGTTCTAWVVSILGSGLKISNYALPAIAVGMLLTIISKKERTKSIGTILLGFGILFVGIEFMSDAFKPIEKSQQMKDILLWVGDRPLLACLVGTLMTILLQSSSASIAIIQLLAFQGAFGNDWANVLRIAIPFVLGDNIGTTITAQLAALRANRNSKRVAWGHTMFNIIGVCYILPIAAMGLFHGSVIWVIDHIGVSILDMITAVSGKEFEHIQTNLTNKTIMFYIAFAHSLFNVVNTIIFVPLISLMEWFVTRLIPITEEEAAEKPVVLEEHLLETPEIALDQARTAIFKMAKRGRKAFRQAMEGFFEDDSSKLVKASRHETIIDQYQSQITSYLVALSQRQLSDIVSQELPVLLHTVNDLERVGDHAQNIVELASKKIEQKLELTDQGRQELNDMSAQALTMFGRVIEALEEEDTKKTIALAKKALENENVINQMQLELRRNHVCRMSDGQCSAPSGILFIDMVNNIEKIGDHLTNIAQGLIGGLTWDGVEPKKVAPINPK